MVVVVPKGESEGPRSHFSAFEAPWGLRCVQLFGLQLETDFPFAVRLPAGHPPIDLTLTTSWHLFPSPAAAGRLIYKSPLRGRTGTSLTSLYHSDGLEILRFQDAGEFQLQKKLIEWFAVGARPDLAELRLLGPVLSYWLERRGLTTLHASAVTVDGQAVAFLSRHGGGKSGLAAAMVQAGHPLLTDDLLALEETGDSWEVRPSYPEMRMWPDEAAHFVGSPENLPLVQADSEKRRVTIDTFLNTPAPLSRIFLASRRPETEGDIEIHPLSRSEAMIELVRHSFSPRLMEAAGLQPARLDRLARLVRSVPVHRLVYPSGFDRLPLVVASIIKSL
jgi:hypothetical protein